MGSSRIRKLGHSASGQQLQTPLLAAGQVPILVICLAPAKLNCSSSVYAVMPAPPNPPTKHDASLSTSRTNSTTVRFSSRKFAICE